MEKMRFQGRADVFDGPMIRPPGQGKRKGTSLLCSRKNWVNLGMFSPKNKRIILWSIACAWEQVIWPEATGITAPGFRIRSAKQHLVSMWRWYGRQRVLQGVYQVASSTNSEVSWADISLKRKDHSYTKMAFLTPGQYCKELKDNEWEEWDVDS